MYIMKTYILNIDNISKEFIIWYHAWLNLLSSRMHKYVAYKGVTL